jgi:DNA modification methylase
MPRTKTAPAPITPQAPDVRFVPIDTLHPDPQNVRVHPEKNLTAIRDSLSAFGQQKPLVVTPGGLILAGNGTWTAARQLGWTHIATQVTTLDPALAKAYALADNRTGELALWDDAGLADLLRDLQAQELPLPGWDEATLRKLCGTEELVDVAPETHRAEALRQQYGVELGQLWTCGPHRVLCGDATDQADVTRLLAGCAPRLMVTDPPYGVDYHPEWRNAALGEANRAIGRVVNDDRIDWRAAWQLFPGAVAYVWHAGLYAWTVAESLHSAGLDIRVQIVWAKPHFVVSRGHYHGRHEPCWYAVRKGHGAHWVGDHSQSTLWDIAKEPTNDTGHSTQKPLECMARPIRNHDAPEVYDPFLGSGTTLVACENLHRVCYAMDIDPGYVAVSLHRWAVLTGETPVRVEG